MFPGVEADGGCRQINQEPGRPNEVVCTNDRRKPITAGRPRRESEGLIVVLKPGNSGGAKEPCRERVSARGKEIRLVYPLRTKSPHQDCNWAARPSRLRRQ